jgi:uncharacterized protein (TIGR03437 family)
MRISSFLAGLSVLWLAPLAFAAPPGIQNVLSAASFQQGIASASWTAIIGVNLSTTTRAWATGDFAGNNLPTQLDGVSVTINGKSAFVYFISPGQINVLAPDDPVTGPVQVQVTNSQGASLPVTVNKRAALPALFAYSQLSGIYAVIQAAASYSLVAPPNLIGSGVATYTAAPGENLVLYGTGLGTTQPAVPTGQLVAAPSPTAAAVTVTIGGKPAAVTFAGLVASGLYQVNVTVPALPSGNAAIVLTVGSQASTQVVSVPVQAYVSPSAPTTPQLSGCLSGQVSSVTDSVSLLSYGRAVSASIGGTSLCATCTVKPPIYPEFAQRLELALEKKEAVQVCYDKTGTIYQLTVVHP